MGLGAQHSKTSQVAHIRIREDPNKNSSIALYTLGLRRTQIL